MRRRSHRSPILLAGRRIQPTRRLRLEGGPLLAWSGPWCGLSLRRWRRGRAGCWSIDADRRKHRLHLRHVLGGALWMAPGPHQPTGTTDVEDVEHIGPAWHVRSRRVHIRREGERFARAQELAVHPLVTGAHIEV